ncbi:E3 ubiquitin-protein ligase MARCH6 [Xylariales sp. AK1849]|nr:E3 ubiquitin-protein ligase MARCH6 [Xylariales sp. AK1849]
MDNYLGDIEPHPAEFPNTILRRRASTAQSDNMADAAAAETSTSGASASMSQPAANGNESVAGDADTCRICRGEGTPSEPLFYPCKCSGSIKYVHQDCLMEWLSHSQKKHCELCKTPFRFTKLYSPNMPKRLPFYVFVSHMAKYLFRNILIWMRAALVITVWLGWLPYAMRKVWSTLFWISDEGFGPTSPPFFGASQNATAAYLSSMAATVTSQGLSTTTCPSSPLFHATTTAASERNIIAQIPNILHSLRSPLTLNASDSLAASLARWIFGSSILAPERITRVSLNATHTANIAISTENPRYASLLSEVRWLKSLTRLPLLNAHLIYVLEGQIITILVIVSFILIILVRDYVVQQQPEINMRAAFAAQMNNVVDEAQDPERQHGTGEPQPADLPQPAGDDADSDLGDEEAARDDDSITVQVGEGERHRPTYRQEDDMVDPHEPHQRPIAGFRRRVIRRDTFDDDVNGWRGPSAVQSTASQLEILDGARDRLIQAQASSDDPSQTTVNQYLRIYREADGDQEKILRIIHDEGLEDRLSYWVNVTQAMTKSESGVGSGNGSPSQALIPRRETSGDIATPSSNGGISKNAAGDSGGDTEPSLMPIAPDTREEAEMSQNANGKGKGVSGYASGVPASAASDMTSKTWTEWEKQWNERPGNSRDSANDTPLFPSSRPRATSDGPQRHETINPLANNNWSFSNLAPNPDDAHDTGADGEANASHTETLIDQIPSNIDDNPPEYHGTVHRDGAEAITPGGTDVPPPTDYETTTQQGDAFVVGPIEHPDEENEPPAPRPAATFVDRVADFMWGDIDTGAGDAAAPDAVELFIDDENAPFMNANRGGNGNEDDEDEIDDTDDDDEDDDEGMENQEVAQDVVEAAAAAGIDPEAIEDAEDFDGIMELIGMRGPIAGLFQNAIFCAFLVSITIFLGIFVPYNIGRLAVWVVANPMRIVRMVFSFSRFVQDICLFLVGWTASFVFDLLRFTCKVFRLQAARQFLGAASADAKQLTVESLGSIWDSIMLETTLISSNEIRNFSVVSHEALISVKEHVRFLVSTSGHAVTFIFGGEYASKWTATRSAAMTCAPIAFESLKNMTGGLMQPGSWTINLHLPETMSTFDPSLAYWSAKDRTLAVISGYVSLSVIAGLYLGRGTPFSSGRTAQEWEASVIDALNQASGVMKVILIISIEMLVFPLYCGLLLDFALLPLFESTSFRSRLMFTYNYPLTSIFVHWFVGTGYMFHFALFVSMCRKIMRKGVLYFIRDPDDPEFHPVRDVLERNVATQLRKILFSAFVYGALVVICLGGVVWGLSLALPNVLPIHYSSNEPVLEFPIDLLFYNFLMPLAVKFFKPSDGLHAMYTWWFRRCARTLRLTWFLFGERRIDEEGTLMLAPESPAESLPWYRKFFLEVSKGNKVVPKTWADTFEGGKSKPTSKIQTEEMILFNAHKTKLVDSGQFIPNGRFVRTPASDQVKIPKGQPVFLNVSERDLRTDGKPDRPETDIYSGKNYQFVYVPPWFRLRIFLFILFIWLFAAVTGVGFTIVPLVFGRRMFKLLIPAHIRTNDIYAFSIGIYILGSLGYFVFHARPVVTKVRDWLSTTVDSILDRDGLHRIVAVAKQAVKLGYTYTMLLIVFPLLITLVMELYILMPLHTWKYSRILNPTQSLTPRSSFDNLRDGHTIRVIQAWTLGILYLKLGSRALVMLGGRPAQAVRAVLRRGWLEPDTDVLTRAFVVPGAMLSIFLAFLPPVLFHAIVTRGLTGNVSLTHEERVIVFRMSYPIVSLFCIALWTLGGMVGVLDRWRARVRDEAYLMGERLHNFGGLVGAKGTATAAGREWGRGNRL